MMNKCLSQDDHGREAFPRPGLNLDLNRNACTFSNPTEILSFINTMKGHDKIDSHPVRIKNMMLFDTDRAEEQFFYRAILINWLYTPGLTYKELASQAGPLWDLYYNYERVPGYGEKDPQEPPGSWRQHIRVARDYLESPELEGQLVQFIVETQLLLTPYLLGRQKTHFLYKIARATSPEALCSDFRTIAVPDARSFDERDDAALRDMHAFLADETLAVNQQRKELQGATKLWKVAEQGHVKAAREILRHPSIDPNVVRRATQTTPLHIAAYLGHHDIVRELLAHPRTDVNLGNLNSHASPLFVAAQQGHELVVEMFLDAPGIDVNKATSGGVTPLIQACSQKHEHIVQLLVSRAADLNVEHVTNDGVTAAELSEHHKAIQDHLAAFRRNSLERHQSTRIGSVGSLCYDERL